MKEKNPHIIDACMRLMRPLARTLLRQGLSSYDFSRIANIAFVRAAEEILVEQGKLVSFSRISAITGLHRHVVSEIVRLTDASAVGRAAESDKDYQRNRLSRVLAGWFESPEYTDRQGKPLPLPIDGPTPSFSALVRSFSGDIYPKIVLDELLHAGAVRKQKDGKFRVMTRRYARGGADPTALKELGVLTGDMLATLEHNMSAPPDSRRFVDSVGSDSIDRAALPLLRRLLRERGTAFLNDVEGWVTENEKGEGKDTVRAGVVVQMYVDESLPASPAPPKRRPRR